MSDREQVRQELHRLADQHAGGLTPEMVVSAAADPSSPLHPHFEWDDSSAAKAYRLWQARSLIGSFEIIHVRPDGQRSTLREFPSVQLGPGDRRYIPIEIVAQDQDFLSAVIADFDRALVHFADRVRSHSDPTVQTRYGRILTAIQELLPAEEGAA